MSVEQLPVSDKIAVSKEVPEYTPTNELTGVPLLLYPHDEHEDLLQ